MAAQRRLRTVPLMGDSFSTWDQRAAQFRQIARLWLCVKYTLCVGESTDKHLKTKTLRVSHLSRLLRHV